MRIEIERRDVEGRNREDDLYLVNYVMYNILFETWKMLSMIKWENLPLN